MRSYFVCGIDPGIKNTGCIIVRGDTDYKLYDRLFIQSSSEEELGTRLEKIYTGLQDFLDLPGNHLVDALAIEKVFHNKNVSSSASTQQVIGIVHLVARQRGLLLMEFTPQQIKQASGLGARANKSDMLNTSSRLLKTDFKTHHEADAALCAVLGVMKLRSKR